ncbi:MULTISPECIES: DUF2799 domain-containing protein [Rhizobium]|uniref:DUF2799 domain-containing protein n=1 Tax=Rhizobium TaxID=379 RepID=UPI001B335298|nr:MULTISPECIES: DUF2799 domain-containing protein [Rhizobium]MBX4905833.1 DUF2799 domain-containing protein [Rhizobium bangladeshense]MBX5212687.1 DUF2799 domain-containing protein [Rhizobium sp. NLR9a]MBX5220255.1 DUF2799 domain-containing protein [Rhizobium sp. NLR8a]MBX5225335.1 DUF2799 domain-containing protein [Rhizobium sp. NLR9b]MBX5231602.1 DUF2799 domain-containing protein [Rhizobium sp. NLR4a]
MIRLFFALAAAIGFGLLLASCNTLSKEECVAADWRVIGESDGAAGYEPQQRFAAHAKSCERVKIVPDQTIWFQGYQSGLVRYCTPLSGLARGQAGSGYANVCPPETASGFLRGFNLGSKQHGLQERLNSMQNDYSSKEAEIDELSDRLKDAKDGDRSELRRRIEDLEDDMHDIRRDQRDVQDELDRVNEDVEWFQRNPTAELRAPGY